MLVINLLNWLLKLGLGYL